MKCIPPTQLMCLDKRASYSFFIETLFIHGGERCLFVFLREPMQTLLQQITQPALPKQDLVWMWKPTDFERVLPVLQSLRHGQDVDVRPVFPVLVVLDGEGDTKTKTPKQKHQNKNKNTDSSQLHRFCMQALCDVYIALCFQQQDRCLFSQNRYVWYTRQTLPASAIPPQGKGLITKVVMTALSRCDGGCDVRCHSTVCGVISPARMDLPQTLPGACQACPSRQPADTDTHTERDTHTHRERHTHTHRERETHLYMCSMIFLLHSFILPHVFYPSSFL